MEGNIVRMIRGNTLSWLYTIALFVVSCLGIAYYVTHNIYYTGRGDIIFANELCTTDVCKEAARSIQENRFLWVDPCDNFYDFVCGRWDKTHPLVNEDDSVGQFDETERRTDFKVKGILESADKTDDLESIKSARKFYRICLASINNVDQGFQNIVSQLAVWGGWPIISQNWKSEKFDWPRFIVELKRSSLDEPPLFDMGIRRNPKDTSKNVIELSTADSPKICTLMSKIDDPKAVRDLITQPAKQILNFTKEGLPDSFDTDVQDIIDFAKKLCEIVNEPFETEPSDIYPSTKLNEFQGMSDALSVKHHFSQLNWKTFLQMYIYGSRVKLELEDVIVVQPESILELIKLIDITPQRTLANYLLLHKVTWGLDQLYEDLLGDKYAQEKTCIEHTRIIFPHAIGHEYIKLYFTEDDKEAATKIVKSTLDSFITDLSENEWMDEPTRSAAVEKAKYMVPIVGYPDWYKNTSKIDEMYSEIKVGDFHLTNLESATRNHIIYRAKLLHEKTERGLFTEGADKTNAEYLMSENIIHIPAGILQPPFYVKGRPDSLNFGSLVSIIGHEITHAFDFSGSKADRFGNEVYWWSNASLNTYIEKAACFDVQYSTYNVPELHTFKEKKYRHINGLNTMNENLADNGGLEAAFNAFTRYSGNETKNTRLPGIAGYSPQQLFFIGFTTVWCETATSDTLLSDILLDEHSPSKYRALIALSNSDDFAEAWNCPVGSTMNPKYTCKLW